MQGFFVFEVMIPRMLLTTVRLNSRIGDVCLTRLFKKKRGKANNGDTLEMRVLDPGVRLDQKIRLSVATTPCRNRWNVPELRRRRKGAAATGGCRYKPASSRRLGEFLYRKKSV